MSENPIPHRALFSPTPDIENRDAVMAERKKYSQILTDSAAKLHDLDKKAYTDPLTGLPNRRAFNEHIESIFNDPEAREKSIALMIIDIDGLKRTNETLGHLKGDKLIQSVASAFRSSAMNLDSEVLRPSDIFGRFEGDEYFAILLDYKPLEGQTIQELNDNKESNIQTNFIRIAQEIGIPDELHVGLSIGISVIQPGDTVESFIERADVELKNKKAVKYESLRKNDIEFHDDRTDRF